MMGLSPEAFISLQVTALATLPFFIHFATMNSLSTSLLLLDFAVAVKGAGSHRHLLKPDDSIVDGRLDGDNSNLYGSVRPGDSSLEEEEIYSALRHRAQMQEAIERASVTGPESTGKVDPDAGRLLKGTSASIKAKQSKSEKSSDRKTPKSDVMEEEMESDVENDVSSEDKSPKGSKSAQGSRKKSKASDKSSRKPKSLKSKEESQEGHMMETRAPSFSRAPVLGRRRQKNESKGGLKLPKSEDLDKTPKSSDASRKKSKDSKKLTKDAKSIKSSSSKAPTVVRRNLQTSGKGKGKGSLKRSKTETSGKSLKSETPSPSGPTPSMKSIKSSSMFKSIKSSKSPGSVRTRELGQRKHISTNSVVVDEKNETKNKKETDLSVTQPTQCVSGNSSFVIQQCQTRGLDCCVPMPAGYSYNHGEAIAGPQGVCKFDYATVCEGACHGSKACFLAGKKQEIGPQSCKGVYSCFQSTAHIGGGSCRGPAAYNDFDSVYTGICENSYFLIGHGSCLDHSQACELVHFVGDHSCQSKHLCMSAAFVGDNVTHCAPDGTCHSSSYIFDVPGASN